MDQHTKMATRRRRYVPRISREKTAAQPSLDACRSHAARPETIGDLVDAFVALFSPHRMPSRGIEPGFSSGDA